MIDSLSSREFDLGYSKAIVNGLVDFAVGRSDDWDFFIEDRLSDEHQNYVINTVIGCNQDLEWLRDYQASLTQGPNLEAVFARLVQPEFRDCIIGKFEDYIRFRKICDSIINNEAYSVTTRSYCWWGSNS